MLCRTCKTLVNNYLYQLVNGKKIIALTENGPIPNPDDCFAIDAPWSYFMSWDPNVVNENSTQNIKDVFTNPIVLVLEPSKPQTPVGATELPMNPANQRYSTTVLDEATSYLWKVKPPTAATISGTGSNVTLDFDSAFFGKAKLTVAGVNGIGTGLPSDTLTITVTKTVIIGISKLSGQDDVQIYPNPSHGYFEVKVSPEVGVYSIEICDLSSKSVYKPSNITRNNITINTSGIEGGVYILKIKSKAFQFDKKLVLTF